MTCREFRAYAVADDLSDQAKRIAGARHYESCPWCEEWLEANSKAHAEGTPEYEEVRKIIEADALLR
jgi:hypothetical protein